MRLLQACASLLRSNGVQAEHDHIHTIATPGILGLTVGKLSACMHLHHGRIEDGSQWRQEVKPPKAHTCFLVLLGVLNNSAKNQR